MCDYRFMAGSTRTVPALAWEMAAAFLACLVLALPSLTFPMGIDHGMFGVWAQQMSRGDFPYRDLWENRPPLPHLLHYLVYAAGVRGMLLTRVTDLGVQLATVAALSALGFRLFGRGAGLLAGAFYAYCYFGQADYFHTSQPDGFLGVFVALALLTVLRQSPSSIADSVPSGRRLVGAGVLLGLACAAKYTAALAFPVAILCTPGCRTLRDRLRPALLIVAGAAIPGVLLFSGLAFGGAVEDFLFDTLLYNITHNKLGPERPDTASQLQEVVAQVLNRREVVAPLLLLPLARADRAGVRTCLLWLGAAALMVVAQRKFYSYHFLNLVPPLAVLSAGAVRGLVVRQREERLPALRKASWSLALVLALFAGYRTVAIWGRSASMAISVANSEEAREAFYALHVNPRIGFSLGDELAAARALRARARQGDTLYALGPPLLYYLSELDPASRFIFDNALLAKGHSERYDRTFEAELRKRPPDFVAVYLEDACPNMTGYQEPSVSLLRLQPALEAELAKMERFLELKTLALYARPRTP
jgi:hypothetical protein